jgi:hypothetical protein
MAPGLPAPTAFLRCRCLGISAAALVEGYSNTLLFSPNDVAGNMLPIGGQDQGEFIGNADRCVHVQHGPGVRHIADRAINGTAAELDRSGLQYAVPRHNPLFIHGIVLNYSV